jgi:16S rRNA (adenine1518-N6/adenine1519-N6)-dimethyltransferase
VDPGVATRIVEAVGATREDLVCEIGAGAGALTALLAGRAGRVVALEVDPALHARLAVRARAWPTVDVRLADARTFPYETLRGERPAPSGRVLVAGNLPYSASKPILLRLFEARAAVEAVTVMLQREVAERLAADPGSRAYGVLSVLWQVWSDVALLFVVRPGAFRPPPAVESAVVQATFRHAPRVAIADEATFVRVVKAGFAQRRKTLANSLRAAGLPGAPVALAGALRAAGIDGRRRAETLTLGEFARLAQVFAASEGA